MAKTKAKAGVTVNELSFTAKADRRSIRKWLEADAIKKTTSGRYDPKLALACIRKHQDKKPVNGESTIDPETGLSWFQANLREQTIDRRRKNEIEERLKNETLMPTATVEKLVLMFINKLELVPVKLESEFSLPENVVKRVRELLDEARKEMAKGILK